MTEEVTEAMTEKIRAKQADKPTGSSLPIAHLTPRAASDDEVGRLRAALEEADLRACMIAEAIMNGCPSQKAIDELQGLQRKVVAALSDHTTKDDE